MTAISARGRHTSTGAPSGRLQESAPSLLSQKEQVVLFHVGTCQYVERLEDWTLTEDRDDAMLLDIDDAVEILKQYRRQCNARYFRRGLDESLVRYAEQWVMGEA